MKKVIDCLIIGPNEMDFANYKNITSKFIQQKASIREMSLNYVHYMGKDYRASELIKKIVLNVPQDRIVGSCSINDTVNAAILYLGTAIHHSGLTFDYVKAFQSCKQDIVRILSENDVLSIAITTTLYVTPWPIIEIIKFVKKYSTAPIIVGGAYINGQNLAGWHDSFMSVIQLINADFYIVCPYGEDILCEIIHGIKFNGLFDKIPNIYYKNNSSYSFTFSTEDRYQLEDHRVDWKLFEKSLGNMVTTRTSISCPFSCAFCEYPLRAGKYRMLDIDTIEKELKTINGIEGIESISFIDDTFNVPQERFKDILRIMIKNRFRFKWYSYFRCQYADDETLNLMNESGCEGVILGIESGSQFVLDNMNKKVNIEKYRYGLKLLNELNIPSIASFIIGFPGETEDTAKETMEFIESCKPTFYKLWLWYYSPFTPIHNLREKYKLTGAGVDWQHSTMDSSLAQDIIEAGFINIRNSSFSSFYFEDIINLLHKGLSIGNIKLFQDTFNSLIIKRLTNRYSQAEADSVLFKLQKA